MAVVDRIELLNQCICYCNRAPYTDESYFEQ